MNEELYGLLGINPEDIRRQQLQSGLLGAGLQLLAGSGYSPVRRTTGELLGQAGAVGVQGMQQAEQDAITKALRGIQAGQLRQSIEEKAAQKQAIQNFVQTLPEDQRARFAAFPTQAAEAMFREPKLAPGVVGEHAAALASGQIEPGTTLRQYMQMKEETKAPLVQNIVGDKATPFEKKAQEAQATVFSGIQESGSKAARSLQSVNKLENILNRVETGGMAAFKQAAGNFGIPTKGLSDIQAAQSIINKLVPEQRPPGSGTMSDADLALYKESLPRIVNQPNANKLIVQSMRDINNYLIKEGQIASDVLDGKISPSDGRKKLLELGNPIQDFFDKNPGLAGTVSSVSQQDRDLINRYLRGGSGR